MWMLEWWNRMSSQVKFDPCLSSVVFSLREWPAFSSSGPCTQAEVGRGDFLTSIRGLVFIPTNEGRSYLIY